MPNCIRCRKEMGKTPFCPYCGAKQERTVARRKRANGEGTAFRKRGTWVARILIPGKESNFSALTMSGFASKTKALDFIPVLKSSVDLPPEKRRIVLAEAKKRRTIADAITYVEDQKKAKQTDSLPFREMYDLWAAFYEPRIDASTMSGHRAALAYFRDVWGVPFASLTADDLQDCIDNCPRGKRTRENMKQLCKRMYEYAIGRLLVQINCAEYLYVPRQKEVKRLALEQAHVDAIGEQIGKYKFAEYIYCLSYLGFRPNEMLRLKKSDYHLSDEGIPYFIGGFKTEAGSDRIVTISPKIQPIIDRLMEAPGEYIFPMADGSIMNDEFLRRRVFYPLFEHLGIQPYPSTEEKALYVPYSCRHFFSNLLKHAPGADKEKAALIGHSNYDTTRRVYQTAELSELYKITNSF